MDREIRIQKLSGQGWQISAYAGEQLVNQEKTVYPYSAAAIDRAFELSANYDKHGLKTHIQINCKEG